jgi:hypothetical protein
MLLQATVQLREVFRKLLPLHRAKKKDFVHLK